MSEQSTKPPYTKPLPDMRPEGDHFWAAMQRAQAAAADRRRRQALLVPAGARARAPSSRSSGSSPRAPGTVYTYSVHYIGPSKAYKGDPPHTVALIDLDEGVRMMSNLVKDEEGYPSIDPEDVSIGMKVRVVFHDVTDEITLPKFVAA